MNGIQSVGNNSRHGLQLIARTTAAQNVTSSTDPVPANGLAVPVKAGESYIVRAFVPFSVFPSAAGGFKFSMSGGAAGHIGLAYMVFDGVSKTMVSAELITNDDAQVAGALSSSVASHFLIIEGTLLNVTADGDLRLKFAQNASSASPITLITGGYLTLTKIP